MRVFCVVLVAGVVVGLVWIGFRSGADRGGAFAPVPGGSAGESGSKTVGLGLGEGRSAEAPRWHPAGKVQEAQRLAAESDVTPHFMRILAGMTDDDILALARDGAAHEDNAAFVELAFRVLAVRHRAAALAHVGGMPSSPLRDALAGAVAAGWGESEPLAAARWLLDQPAGPARTQQVALLAVALAERRDVSEAIEVVNRLPRQEPGREGAVQHILERAVLADPASGRALLEGWDPTDPAYPFAVFGVGLALSRSDVQQALDLVMERVPEGDLRRGAVLSVLEGDIAARPVQYATWVLDHLDDGLKSDALDRVVPQWGRSDARACADWVLNVCPAGHLRESAAMSALMTVPDLPPAEAARLRSVLPADARAVVDSQRARPESGL